MKDKLKFQPGDLAYHGTVRVKLLWPRRQSDGEGAWLAQQVGTWNRRWILAEFISSDPVSHTHAGADSPDPAE